MKKLLLFFAITIVLSAKSQNIYNYGFSGVSADLTTAGWERTNQSQLASSTALWSISSYVSAASVTGITSHYSDANIAVGSLIPLPNGQAGGANSFCKVNFASTTDQTATGATISNWLISPVITVMNGDQVSFYTRCIRFGTSAFGDSLQLRISSNGAFADIPATGPTDIGDFNIIAANVNPTIGNTTYPTTWTKFTYVVSGLTGETDCKFAFRYYVTQAGFNAPKGDDIGIDTFSVDRPNMATNSFIAQNFAVFPNPATNVINVAAKTGSSINQVEITDINGRIVKSTIPKALQSEINISELTSGVYFVKVVSDLGSGSTKFVKQ